MKYVIFPGEPNATCQECMTPILQFVLTLSGDTPSGDFDELVVKMDDAQMRDFGAQDPQRPDIVEERSDLTCDKCGRVGVSAA